MLSSTNAITESWMTHRKAAEIRELEIPRRYTEDSTASKATNERAKATLDQVRSGCFPLWSGMLSMPRDSYRRQRSKAGEVVSRVRGYCTLNPRTLWELSGSFIGRRVGGLGIKFKQHQGAHHQILAKSSCDIMQDLNSFVPQTWVRNSFPANQGPKLAVISSSVCTYFAEGMYRINKISVGRDEMWARVKKR
jgi:hypothetical protein